MRLRLDLSYDGTDFSGWAAQPGLRTVQATLEEGLATVLRLPRARVTVAGRTDAGVHARGQVAHLDIEDDALSTLRARSTDSPEVALLRRLAGILPPDLRVRRVTQAPLGFDARYSASWRRYAYRVVDDLALADPLLRRHVLTWPNPLDLGAMNAAATKLTGLSDFAAFCRKREGATTIRTLIELNWARNDAGLAVGTVVADAFCHNMVRALVGCLLAVGDGRRPQAWPAEVLAARTRHGGVTVVPAHGLTLEEVRYPEGAELAAQAVRAQARRTAL